MKSKNIRKNINAIVQLLSNLCSILLLYFASKSIGLSSSMYSPSNNYNTNDAFGEILIIDDFILEQDTAIFGISINLNEGWYSYWRHAGEIGLPTVIYFEYQPSLKGHKVYWPKPTVKDSKFGISFIYKENVTIPVLLHLSQKDLPLSLILNLEIGVCKDICIPIRKRIKIDLDKLGSSSKVNELASVLADIKKSHVKLNPKNWYCSIDMREENTFLDFNIKLSDEYINSIALLEYDKVLIDIIQIKEKIEDSDLSFSILMDESQLPNLVISKSKFTLHLLSEKKQASVFGCI